MDESCADRARESPGKHKVMTDDYQVSRIVDKRRMIRPQLGEMVYTEEFEYLVEWTGWEPDSAPGSRRRS
eukprot:COSAG04_NODE_23_length_37908_cov_41.289825_16_plen_70_part_00